MNNDLKSRLPHIVLQFLSQNSGGVKLTELIAHVTSNIMQNEGKLPPNFVEEFEPFLEAMDLYNVYVLQYDWDMGGSGLGPWRSKAFVYTAG